MTKALDKRALESAARIAGLGAGLVAAVAGRTARAEAPPTPLIRAPALEAVRLPDPAVPGFHLPESEATVLDWIQRMEGPVFLGAAPAFEQVHLHAWGLWTALTLPTAQTVDGQALRVFETWYSAEELAGRTEPAGTAALTASGRRRGALRPLKQVSRGHGPGEFGRILGFVKYDPTSADHILQQGLLSVATLDRLWEAGIRQIPAFPPGSIVVKPVFQVLTSSRVVQGRYAALKAWSGPPGVPQSWGSAKWPGAVWVDLLGGGRGRGAVDPVGSSDGSSRTEATTYPVSSFLRYRLGAEEAAALNQEQPGTGARDGDTAILVALHAATREITRWTWQTFWWAPDPDNPPAPSSSVAAALRPAGLQGAPRHYALALAYDMVSPGQPETGGQNAGLAIYAYNPWLEAGFSPEDLPDSTAGFGPDGQPASNQVGVQSNCMSCHSRANYNPARLTTAPAYSGARYVDLDDPAFTGTLQVDLLWSLPENAR